MIVKKELSLVNESAVRSLGESLEETFSIDRASLRSWEGAFKRAIPSNPSCPSSGRGPIWFTTGKTATSSNGGWQLPSWI